MANGAFNFKDSNGNIVSFISGSGSDIIMSGGTLNLSSMTGLTLGNLTMEGTVETASFAPNYLLTSSFESYTGTTDTIIGSLQTSTSSLNSFTSSTESRLDSIEGVSGSYATTGSNTFNGNLTVTGYIDAQELRTTYISSSILYRSGSTKFGDESTDNHEFTGSLLINGTISGTGVITGNGDASTSPSFIANNTTGDSGTPQHYIDFKAGATTIGKIFRGNGASDVVGNGLNIDNYDGFQVRLNQLGGTGGTFNVNGGDVGIGTTDAGFKLDVNGTLGVTGAATFSSSVTTGGTIRMSNTAVNRAVIIGVDSASEPSIQAVVNNSDVPRQLSINPSGGNVGIGTTSPTVKLHVVTTAVAGKQNMAAIDRTATNLIRFTNPQHSTLASMGLLLRVFPDSDARQGAGIIASGGSNNATTDLDLFVTTSPDGLGGTSYSAIKINGLNGNVGIGTTSPSSLLQVGSTTVSSGGGPLIIYGFDGAAGLYTTRQESNYNAALYLHNNPSGVVGNGTGIIFRARSSSTDSRVQGAIYTSWTTSTDASRTAKLVFQTVDSGTTSDKVTILGNGNVGIGTTSPEDRLDVNGSIRFRANTSNFTEVPDSGVIDFVPTSIFPTTPRIRIAAIGTASVGASIDFMTGTSSSLIGRMLINSDGNVGIGTTAPSYKLDVNGTGRFSGVITAGNRVASNNSFSDADAVRVLKPLGGFRNSFTSTETGAIKITYPVGYTNTMHRVKVNIYNYAGNQAYTVYFGGYNYAPGSSWINTFAYTITPSKTNFNPTVRFGYDGEYMVVYIGELNASWSYPQIFIEEVETGFALLSQFATDSWEIGLETSAFQNVTSIQSNTQSTNWARNGNSVYFGIGNVGIGTTSPEAKLQVTQNSNEAVTIFSGNSTDQGTSFNYKIVRHYPQGTNANKLIIPFVNQGSLNSNTIVRIMGHSSRFNTAQSLGFTAEFCLGHLTSLSSLVVLSTTGNVSGIAINGMNIEISFTNSYLGSPTGGIFATIEFMTNVPAYSIIIPNIAMN